MSNKTQLQTNNTQLASLIQTLQGKATGGGGASVETCQVSMPSDLPTSYVTCDAAGNVTSEISKTTPIAGAITVVKGTYIHVQAPSGYYFNCGTGATLVTRNSFGALISISPTAPDNIYIDYWFD